MRIVMMATGPFAVPTLRTLYKSPHSVDLLVTQPPRETHGKARAPANPLRTLAQQYGTPVFDPVSVNTDQARAELARRRPDVLVVCDYGQILKPETLAVAPLGGVNLHGSLLPQYRGAAPVQWAIFHGEHQTGVSVIHMTPQLDAGPVIARVATAIDPHETATELEPRLAELGAPLVVEAIEALDAGRAQAIEQDRALASRAPRLKKSDGQIDWSRPAEAIANQVRAMQPWPKSHTTWRRERGEPLRLIVERVSPVPCPAAAEPGTVVEADERGIVVATGRGCLTILELQPAGKRVLAAAEFLRGYPLRPGERLSA